MDQEKIGKFIFEMRKEKKLTQEELGEYLGISNRSISKWENGKSMPDISLFKPLCEILDISYNELLSGEKLNKYWVLKGYENTFDGAELNIVGQYTTTSDMAGFNIVVNNSTCANFGKCIILQKPDSIYFLDYENKTGEQLANEDLYNVVVCDKWVVNVTPRIVPYTTSALANTDITRDEMNNTVMSVPIAIYNSDDVNTRVPLEDLPFEIYFLKGELPDYYNMDEKTRNRQLKDDLRRAYAIPNAYSFSTIKQGDVTSTGNPYTDADIGKKYLKFKIGSVYNENETIKEKNTILLVCKGTTDRDINVMPDIIPIPLILGTANIWQMIKPNTLTSYGKGTITWIIASSYAWCRRSDGAF